MRRAVLTIVLAVATASAAAAQRPEAPRLAEAFKVEWGPRDQHLGLRPERPSLSVSARVHPTRWVEGGLIGGVVVGGGLAVLAALLYDPDSGDADTSRERAVISAGLLGGFCGFIIGALIGGASPKPVAP